MPAPAPVWAIVRAAIVNHRRGCAVINRPLDNFFGSLHHLRSLRSWPMRRSRDCGSPLLRHAPGHVEPGLNREALFVLPADLAPALLTSAGVDQAATRNLGNDLAPGAGCCAKIQRRADISWFPQCRCREARD